MDETRDYLADLISCKRAIFKYEGFLKVPRFVVYGGIKLVTRSGTEGMSGPRTLCKI